MSDTTIEPAPERVEAEEVLRIFEEVAHVGVRAVESGRVRIATHTEAVEEFARAELHGETIEVTRVPRNETVMGAPPQMREEDGVTIVPVLEEVLVVEKRLVLKEELHIRRRATVETVAVPVTLRRQTATVERIEPATPSDPDSAG